MIIGNKDIETSMRSALLGHQNMIKTLHKQVERAKFERQCLESENWELRDQIEIIKLRVKKPAYGITEGMDDEYSVKGKFETLS